MVFRFFQHASPVNYGLCNDSSNVPWPQCTSSVGLVSLQFMHFSFCRILPMIRWCHTQRGSPLLTRTSNSEGLVFDADVVNLIFGWLVGGNPLCFIDVLVWENRRLQAVVADCFKFVFILDRFPADEGLLAFFAWNILSHSFGIPFLRKEAHTNCCQSKVDPWQLGNRDAQQLQPESKTQHFSS